MAQSTLSNAYFLRFGNFCAYDNNDNDNNDNNNNDNNNNDNDNNDDRTDYFTPCACARGNYCLVIV